MRIGPGTPAPALHNQLTSHGCGTFSELVTQKYSAQSVHLSCHCEPDWNMTSPRLLAKSAPCSLRRGFRAFGMQTSLWQASAWLNQNAYIEICSERRKWLLVTLALTTHDAFIAPLLVRGDDLQGPFSSIATLAYLTVFITAMAAAYTRAVFGVRAQQIQIGVSCFGMYSAGVDGDFDIGTE
jgi:hypothetical protein